MQAWLADLPRVKQQPNLVFAAARWHGAPAPAPYDALRQVLLGDEDVKATILARSTQTNEAGRLATLTPVLAACRRAAGTGRGRRQRGAVPLPGPLRLPVAAARRAGRRAVARP